MACKNVLLRFLVVLPLMAFVAVGLYGADRAKTERFLSRVAADPVSLDFEISQENVAGVIARGSLLYFKGRYFVQSDVYRVYCDSLCKYTVDDYTMEAVYEHVDPSSGDVFSNPSLIFSALSSSVEFEFPSKGDCPSKARYTDASNGNVYIFKLTNLRFPDSAPSDDEFRPADLGPKYVITDLR